MVSGIFTGTMAFGQVVGPIAGGAVVTQIGFPWFVIYSLTNC